MSENVSNLILEQLREMREENAKFRAETKSELAELRNLIGGQGVILTSIAGYSIRSRNAWSNWKAGTIHD